MALATPVRRLARRLPPLSRDEFVSRIQGQAVQLVPFIPTAAADRITRLLRFQTPHHGADPHLNFLLALKSRTTGLEVSRGDILSTRTMVRRDLTSIVKRHTAVKEVIDLTLSVSDTVTLGGRFYVPLHENPALPLLMYFHGGGFMTGDLDTHDEACRMIAHHGGFRVLSVDYRLCPEHDSLTPLKDCCDAVKWAQENASRFGKARGQIAVGGDSAGGNLAAGVCQQTAGTDYQPCAQLLIYPSVDFTHDYDSYIRYGSHLVIGTKEIELYRQAFALSSGIDPSDPRLSPIHGNLEQLPPALVATAEFDVVRDEGEAYAAKLREAGNIVEMRRMAGQGHAFINMTTINQSARWATIQLAKDFAILCEQHVNKAS